MSDETGTQVELISFTEIHCSHCGQNGHLSAGKNTPQGKTVYKLISGPPGVRGSDGTPGDRGLTGPPGPPGRRGKRGFTGRTGPPGENGPDGPQGPQGPRGFDGEPGPQGRRGETGKDGAKGDKGDSGIIDRNFSHYVIKLNNIENIGTEYTNLDQVGAHTLMYSSDDTVELSQIEVKRNVDVTQLHFQLTSSTVILQARITSLGTEHGTLPHNILAAGSSLHFNFLSNDLYTQHVKNGAIFHIYIRWLQ